MRTRVLVVFAAMAMIASGCSMHRDVTAAVDAQLPDASAQLEGRREGVLSVDDGVYVSTQRQPLARQARLPALEDKLDLRVQVALPLRAMFAEIEQLSGIRIRVLPDADEQVDAISGAAGVALEYAGPVSGLLDDLASRYGIHWRVGDGDVIVFSRETRVYEIQLPQSTSDSRAAVTKQGQTSSSGGQDQGATSQQETALSLKSDVFPEAEAAIKAILSPKGTVSISRSARMLVVTDAPSVLDRVGEIVDRFNGAMNRRTMIDVTIYEVVANDSQKAGLRWDLVWESLSSRYQVVTGSGPIADSGDSTIGVGVIDNTYTYGGSQVLLDALAKQGRVVSVRRQQITAANGRAVTVGRTNERGFIESVSTTQVPQVGVVNETTQATVSTGVALTVFPQILDTHEILLDTVVELSTLDQLRRVSNGTNSIELPEVSRTQFSPSVRLRSGETVLLVGLSQDQQTANASGVGSALWQGFGGGRDGARQRSVLLVQLTAVVM